MNRQQSVSKVSLKARGKSPASTETVALASRSGRDERSHPAMQTGWNAGRGNFAQTEGRDEPLPGGQRFSRIRAFFPLSARR